ncbi:endonuclease/exonuclease/phosphatase family protein [Bacillus sp. IITD106]|nr:endonuclease/exonuclease/phosphatase family protein [Bacillus sp. IITD106]
MNLRIMTYNVRNDCDPPPNSWEERKGLIRDLIVRESPDIIGTQECKFNQVKDLDHLLEDYDWIGLGREGGSKSEFMTIFYKKSRFDVLEYNHFWLSDTPNVIASSTWGNDCTRMATWVHFLDKETNQSFYHLNTHLDHISEEARVKGAGLIVEQAEAFDSSIPLFITGDFNTVAKTDTHQVFLTKGSFIDTWDSASKRINEELGSFNNFDDATGGEGRIDWILYRGDVKAGVLKIVNDQVDGRFPSDHFPIVVDFEV